MKRVKEYYEVSINNELKLIQVIRTEKKKERNTDGSLNVNNWIKIIDGIMKTYFNTDKWEYKKNVEDKNTKIRLKL
jgi:hypothetical protein